MRAFGIDNASTTNDKGYRLAFKVEAKKKMSTVGPAEWKRIAELSEQPILDTIDRECR